MAGYDPSLDFECPICRAPPTERCALMSGNFRSASHSERGWIPSQQNTAEPTGNLGEAMKVKKTKATAKPRGTASKKEKAAEVAKTPKPSREKIEQLDRK